MAAIALCIGVGLLPAIPEDAPINRGGWVGLKKAAFVLFFPGIVYIAFVFYGGQRAAFEGRPGPVWCDVRGVATMQGFPGDSCPTCGHLIPPTDR